MTAKLSILSGLLCLAAAGLSGCSLMHDDLEPCPSGVDLKFVYDYNIQRADMFPDHVGSVTVYVFDQNGRYITQQEDFNTAAERPLASHDYRMHLDLAPGTYQFIALAHQKSVDECLASKGAKYRRTDMISSQHSLSDLKVTLDRINAEVRNEGVHLDTLWHGMSATPLVVRDMEAAQQTISLMRNTKNLTVSLHELDDRAGIIPSDYEIKITAANGVMNHDNSPAADETLTYTPYAVWTTEFPSPEEQEANNLPVQERTVHAALSFNRIMHRSARGGEGSDALLTIYNKRSQKTVATIDLADCLAQGRGAFEYLHYSPQEFLDREYDYKLDFFLKGDTWQYIDLSISILSWSKRIQRVSFE